MNDSNVIQPEDRLLTQSEARDEAKRLNQEWTPEGMVNIAHPVPFSSWGGHEKGWSVSLVAAS